MDDDDPLAEILDDWRERRDRGEEVDPLEVIRAHPEHADRLRMRFATLEAVGALCARPAPAEGGPPDRVGDYRILGELGRGGMGTVYEAEQVSMRRSVALKVLSAGFLGSPKAVKRFEREARAAGRLHHTNIVPVYGMGEDRGTWYYAMELVRGRSLADLIAEMKGARDSTGSADPAILTGGSGSGPSRPNGRTSRGDSGRAGHTTTTNRSHFARLARMFADVADALEAAHQEGVIHRDVKPANLLLDEDGVLKLVDFGLARSGDEQHAMTLTGDLLGTPLYMSPEQAMAKRVTLDHRTDIYSLGATLYEVLTLRPPFEAANLQDLCSQIIMKDPALPRSTNRQIPRDLETIVLKAIEKDRDKRYSTAAAFARDLESFAEGGPIRARRIGPVGRAWRRVRRHPLRSALIAAVVLLAAVAGGLSIHLAREAAELRTRDYDSLCRRGTEAIYRGGGDSMAADFFTHAIDIDDGRPDAYFYRALSPGRTLAEVLRDLDDALAHGLPPGMAHLAKAAALRSCGNLEASDKERSLASGDQGDGPEVAYLEGYLLARDGKHEQALERLRAADARAADGSVLKASARLLRATLLEGRGDLAGALDELVAVRAAGDETPGLRMRCAALWLRLGRGDRAEALYAKCLEEAQADGGERAWLALERACRSHVRKETGRPSTGEPERWHDEVTRLALEAWPDSGEILWGRHLAYLWTGRFDEALSVLDDLERRHPDWPGLDEGRASVLLATGDGAGALEQLGAGPLTIAERGLKGLILARAGHAEEARAFLEEVLRIAPNEAYVWSNLAAVLHNDLSLPEEALVAAQRARALDPTDPVFLVNLGTILTDLGRAEEARAALELAATIDPGFASAHAELGRLLAKAEPDRALQALDRAIGLDPGLVLARCVRAGILRRRGELERALADLDAALAEDSSPETRELLPKIRVERSLVLSQLGRVGSARADADAAVGLDADLPEAYLARSAAELALDEVGPAWADLEHARELGLEPYGFSENLRGRILDRLGRRGPAAEAYQEAIRLDGTRPAPRFNLGVLAWKEGRHTDALAEIDEAIRLAPSDGKYRGVRALILAESGRVEDAIPDFREAARLLADSGEEEKAAFMRDRLGSALRAAGRIDEAEAAMREAVRLCSGVAAYHSNLGALLCDVRHQYEAACGSFREAIRLGDTLAWHNLGVARSAMGREEDALAAFRESVRADPNRFESHRALGDLLFRMALHAEAAEAFRRCVELRPEDAATRYVLGDALLRTDEFAEAAAAYREAVRTDPELAEAWCNLGMALRHQGLFTEALAATRRGHEVGSRREDWSYPSAEWVRAAERRVRLAKRLPAILAGEAAPADAEERAAFAELCACRQSHTEAARLYEEAFAADPALADDLDAGRRFAAASSALRVPLDEGSGATWRTRALGWLRADLALWTERSRSDPESARNALRSWTHGTGLSAVRDGAALQRLSDAERSEWRDFWADVAALLNRLERDK